MIGIYCIENLVNGKRYVGQSLNIKRRLNDHKSALNRDGHNNSHLQDAWWKYGQYMFAFFVLETCEIDMLDERERYYISLYRTMDYRFGYNEENGGNKMKIMSLEARKKISESRKGRSNMSEEARRKMSERMKGNKFRLGLPMPEASKKKLAEAHKGNKYTLGYKYSGESKKRMSEQRKGRKYPSRKGKVTDETRRKISEALRNNKNRVFNLSGLQTPEVRAKRGAAIKRAWEKRKSEGYKVSDETRKKMSLAWERRRAKKKADNSL